MTIPDALIAAIPLIMVLLSLLAAVLIFPMRDDQVKLRTVVNLIAAGVKVAMIVMLIPPVVQGGARPEFSMPFLPGIDFTLRVDPLALFFGGLSALLWLLTTIYAIGYLRDKPNLSRFFGFFSLCVMATVGISFAGNLLTFLVFYEILTVVTYPLVAHWADAKSLRAARIYLRYALTGGLAVFIGVVWLTIYAGPIDFADGGAKAVGDLATESPTVAILIFALLVGGMGVKAALFPLHGWLPKAMVAPAPVSALLHAVAVVKAGVFGIVRVVDDVYGVNVAQSLGVLTPLVIVASFTIIYGSYHALRSRDIKQRLAYSTVSQVSYVALGIAIATHLSITGGVAHLVHQGIMKITLFFCAGIFAEQLKVHRIDQMRGLGHRMPWTASAFTIAALGMIGLPPTAGFASKWNLGLGALESGHGWVLWVLIASSLLNAAYFLPLIYDMWFREPELTSMTEHVRVREPGMMTVPAVITASLVLVAGLAAGSDFSPVGIAEFISVLVVADP